jgi:VWFA-related protein
MKGLRVWQRVTVVALPALVMMMPVSGQEAPQTFRATVDFVSTDVVVKDKDNKFVPDLTEKDFRVYEDGVLQTLSMFEPYIGGRSLGNLATARTTPRLPVREGLILPAARPRTDSSGRLFIIFIDDFHFTASQTPNVRDVLKKIRDTLIHDNDLVGFVSSGYSSIEINPSYDFEHRRFNEAINKTMGSAPTVDDIVENATTETAEGPQGIRYNAHVAFKTAKEMIDQVAQVPDRRKIFIYVSNGYSFNPYKEARYEQLKQQYAEQDAFAGGAKSEEEMTEEEKQNQKNLDESREGEFNKKTQFTFADLNNEVVQVAVAAQRANVTFYPIDPRGLMTSGDVADTRSRISYADYRDLRISQINSLKVPADETGGFCICETNDFETGLRRIDGETSDYYRIGYTSNNPDPLKVRRQIRVEVLKPGLQEPQYKKEYMLPKPKRTPSGAKLPSDK